MELKKGDKNEKVKELQSYLGLDDDSHFGNDTEKKVIEFQKQNGLKTNGIVDDLVWSKILEIYKKNDVYKTSIDGINLIKKYEGCKLKAYLCPAKIPTIGFGNTQYENGSKVKIGDVITESRSEELLNYILDEFEIGVSKLLKVDVKQNQFDALVCFAYNIGLGNLKKSTVLKLVNQNPSDPSIEINWKAWNKAGGKVLTGLTRRRDDEYKLYKK
jgi:lysozyme